MIHFIFKTWRSPGTLSLSTVLIALPPDHDELPCPGDNKSKCVKWFRKKRKRVAQQWTRLAPPPRPGVFSCRWGRAAAAWAGAKGYRRRACGRSDAHHAGRSGRPGSWCTGWWAKKWAGKSMWWRPARGRGRRGRSGPRCGGAPPAYTVLGGWPTSCGIHHASSPLAGSSSERWSEGTATNRGTLLAAGHLENERPRFRHNKLQYHDHQSAQEWKSEQIWRLLKKYN